MFLVTRVMVDFSRLEIIYICIHYYLNIWRVHYATIKIINGYLPVSRHFFQIEITFSDLDKGQIGDRI